MTKHIGIFLMALLVTASLCCSAHAQTGERKWKKSITLPNGELILDMNGEWDAALVYLRPGGHAPESGKTKITQTGNTFVGIAMTAFSAFRKGKEQIKGELDKSGFKQVQIISGVAGNSDAKGQISEDGNQIIIDDGERFRLILTRK